MSETGISARIARDELPDENRAGPRTSSATCTELLGSLRDIAVLARGPRPAPVRMTA